ncbi:protein LORF4 [Spheniscid alphaherpesvirus 1]|uniref:Protein LORF4 n=1 Tax=Spheniscid alphaherpesvirus 1 TaxID=2560777 RepID=A0A1R3T8K5_9ALPH|nr:protein LORF4 [Spheniscid alphaherpesvirus 1]SCO83487.1 protein LORF4 [Spheniscid alphaherpesvirus 1]
MDIKPTWYDALPFSMDVPYGIVAKPLLLKNIGNTPINARLTGGWKPRTVDVRTHRRTRHAALLWRTPVYGRADTFTSSGHAWFFPLGCPWYVGRAFLPPELLMFLTDRINEDSLELSEYPRNPLLFTLQQLFRSDVPFVQAAVLMEQIPNKIQSGTVELFDRALSQHPCTEGVIMHCRCKNAGSLQCQAFREIVAIYINDALTNKNLGCVSFIFNDGLMEREMWAVSGPSLYWTIKETRKRCTPRRAGVLRITEWKSHAKPE